MNNDHKIKNVTMINDLIDLDDDNSEQNKFKKYIRNYHNVPTESGMSNKISDEEYKYVQPHQHQPQLHKQPMYINKHGYDPVYNHNQKRYTEIRQPEPVKYTDIQENFAAPQNKPTCLDVAYHIAECPICSKFYSCDKNLYLFIILVLVILCFLLLKKCMKI